MSKVQTLRVFVTQRLTAAAEEIFELFERTIAEYEEEHRKLLSRNQTAADLQLLFVSKGTDPPEQQDWSAGLDQEDPPELPHIKEEQEEVWSRQEEAEIIEFAFSPAPVKSEEDDEEEAESSQLHHTDDMKPEADDEDCGGPEPARSSDPECPLQAEADEGLSESELQSDDSCDWEEETGEPESGSNPLQHGEVPISGTECKTGTTSVSSSTSFHTNHHPSQTGGKPFSCSICGREYTWKTSLMAHKRLHTEGKRFSCSVCKKSFQGRAEVVRHMRVHTGEKPFSCSICDTRFTTDSNLTRHFRVHTGEKPFTCFVCQASFGDRGSLARHIRVHTGEKPFACRVCDKRFAQHAHVKSHKCVGESGDTK